ncbi:hypothetical protein [uncultured Parolsenella sp.]|uniref:hypothetical protein n=1 Tax=uncultured Parolsenella sp. TaxID=2083008 RepID=UPI0027D94CBB|nr:hypothetical protein [uncultured Parolsenella sp.]
MDIKPFACTRRPAPADTVGSQEAPASVTDAGRALYAFRFSLEGGDSVTGVLCALSAPSLTDGTLTCSERLRPDDEEAFLREAHDVARALSSASEQVEAMTLAFQDVPALDIILAAATEATPLYDLSPDDAETDADDTVRGVRVWRIGRSDAVKALTALFAHVDSAVVVDQRSHVLAEAFESLAHEGRISASGFLALLVPYGQLSGTSVPRVPKALFRRGLG